MLELNHHYSHKKEWFRDLSNKIGTNLLDDKISIFSRDMAKGLLYYTTVMEGMSILLLDAKFKNELTFTRSESEDDLYILHFDLSDKINPLHIFDANQKQSKKNKSGFCIVHASTKSYYKPIKEQRTYTLRILIEGKKLLNLLGEENIYLKNIDKNILLHQKPNADIKVLINYLKKKSVFDIGFDLYIKGISLKILANFIDSCKQPTKLQIRESELEALKNSNDFMINNLFEKFPGILFLARLSQMSTTRYKKCFVQVFNDTPNSHFNKQRIIFANKLLQSAEFNSVREVSKLFNFSNQSQFVKKYIDHFKRSPYSDLKKRI